MLMRLHATPKHNRNEQFIANFFTSTKRTEAKSNQQQPNLQPEAKHTQRNENGGGVIDTKQKQ